MKVHFWSDYKLYVLNETLFLIEMFYWGNDYLRL